MAGKSKLTCAAPLAGDDVVGGVLANGDFGRRDVGDPEHLLVEFDAEVAQGVFEIVDAIAEVAGGGDELGGVGAGFLHLGDLLAGGVSLATQGLGLNKRLAALLVETQNLVHVAAPVVLVGDGLAHTVGVFANESYVEHRCDLS